MTKSSGRTTPKTPMRSELMRMGLRARLYQRPSSWKFCPLTLPSEAAIFW
jgi:hypothetical protein